MQLVTGMHCQVTPKDEGCADVELMYGLQTYELVVSECDSDTVCVHDEIW